MADYTPTGNPATGASGASNDIRAEFELIQVAIASKANTADVASQFQPIDAQLTDLAGLTPTDNGVVIGNGTNFVVESGSALKTSLGLTIGTNVQAWSSNLDEYSAVNPTAAGLALLDDADAAAQRTTLGLGTLATQNGTFSGTSSGTNTGDNAANSLYSGLVSNATHTGDVTGATVLTIANDAVTYAKIQNVSATDKLLGRSTAGAGDVEEIACTAAGRALLDDADATAQRATLGLVIGTNVQAYDADTPTVSASQAEMEAGTESALRSMSPLRVAQAIAALSSESTLMSMQASTSGTEKDFTSIPAGVKRITISLSGVSLSGTDQPLFQIGDSGGIEATGYLGASSQMVAATASQNYTTGFGIFAGAAATVLHGSLTLTLMDATTNLWAAAGVFALSNAAATVVTAGTKSLSATLDRVRITSTGTNTFDAGNIGVTYEK